ncbi:Astacin [Diplonema papillatum]|nr:Astacin [Diplonema papillatum]
MRAVGAVFDFACIDQATQSCLATITGIETDASAWALASLPVRLGGLGLHSCADTAAIAHIAATFDGEACLPSLVTPYVLPHAMLLDEDDTFLASLEDPRLAPFESVLEKIQNVLQARDNYGGRGQKVWSATVHDERRKALLISMTEELGRSGRLQGSALALKQVQVRARIQSCSAQHASAWLYGNAEADPRLWLSPAELAVAIRLRLGLPIAPMPSICRLCGTGSADVDGVHARSCFSGGRRTRMHNALRDVIADFARRGLLAPAVERPVFSNTERKRPDISYVRDGTTVVLDVAVTFPLQPSNPQYAKRAAEKPGGAATAYATAVKEGKYRGIIDNEPNPREWLAVPLVVDTFGAWCPGALTELRQIARKSALREDRTASAACQDFFHQLSFQLITRGSAPMMLAYLCIGLAFIPEFEERSIQCLMDAGSAPDAILTHPRPPLFTLSDGPPQPPNLPTPADSNPAAYYLQDDDDRISWAVANWEEETCIRFTKCSSPFTCEEPFMVFVSDASRCDAPVGTSGCVSEVNIRTIRYQGWVAHVTAHALGLSRENTRNDRDGYVTLNESNIWSKSERAADRCRAIAAVLPSGVDVAKKTDLSSSTARVTCSPWCMRLQ